MRRFHVVRACILALLLVTAGALVNHVVQAHTSRSLRLAAEARNAVDKTSTGTSAKALSKHIAALASKRNKAADLLFVTPPPPPPDSVNPYAKMRVKNLGPILNTSDDDFAPTITADGGTMFFVSHEREGGVGLQDYWMTTNPSGDDTTWTRPINVRAINTVDYDGSASIAADGQTIYFASNRNTTVKNDINIWTATLEGTEWRNVREVGAPINTTKWETQPSISPDGKKLFFASNRNDDKDIDIYVSHQLADGRWSNPINLGSKINGRGDFKDGQDASPFIAADGVTLYFASNSKPDAKQLDIYRSEWIGPSDTDWTDPMRLPEPINSDKDDMFLTVPASGNVLFFSSRRDGGFGKLDLYVAFNPPPPKATLVLRGTAFDINTQEKLAARVIVTDEQTGDTIYNRNANSATGEYLVVMSSNGRGEMGGSYLVSATEPNHFPYPPTRISIPLRSDTSRIITHDIPMNNEVPPVVKWVVTQPQLSKDRPDLFPNFNGVIIKEQQTIELFALLPMVFFDEGQGTLPNRYVQYTDNGMTSGFTEDTLSNTLNSYYNYLNVLGLRLRQNPTAKIKLIGTNSQDVSSEKSVELSRQRAESVKKYIVSTWGIAPERLAVEARNLPENSTLSTTPEGIEENRRVEVISDNWEIIKPVLFKQIVKVPDWRNVKFSMVNGLREEVIDHRELIISHDGKPWNTITNLGPISATESGDWNWRNSLGKLPTDETPMQVQLKITDKSGREVLSNVDEVGVRQYSIKQVVSDRLADKTKETYNLILFKYNSSDMGKWNHKILESYVYDRIRPNSDVSVNGYTDILGTEDYNAKLSTNRANAVRSDVANKIKGKSASLVAHGFGKTQPLYTNELPEGRYYNRTVQVLVETPILGNSE